MWVWPVKVYMLNPDGDPWKNDHQSWVRLSRSGRGSSLVMVLPQCQAVPSYPRLVPKWGLHRGQKPRLSRPPHSHTPTTTGVYPKWAPNILSEEGRRMTIYALLVSLDQPTKTPWEWWLLNILSHSVLKFKIVFLQNRNTSEVVVIWMYPAQVSSEDNHWGICLYCNMYSILMDNIWCLGINMQIYPTSMCSSQMGPTCSVHLTLRGNTHKWQ